VKEDCPYCRRIWARWPHQSGISGLAFPNWEEMAKITGLAGRVTSESPARRTLAERREPDFRDTPVNEHTEPRLLEPRAELQVFR
jgi:hypothetical protein